MEGEKKKRAFRIEPIHENNKRRKKAPTFEESVDELGVLQDVSEFATHRKQILGDFRQHLSVWQIKSVFIKIKIKKEEEEEEENSKRKRKKHTNKQTNKKGKQLQGKKRNLRV